MNIMRREMEARRTNEILELKNISDMKIQCIELRADQTLWKA